MKPLTRPLCGRGLFYHRDSEASSELAPQRYVEWAISEANRRKVTFDTSPTVISKMIKTGVSSHDPIFLDYGTSGNILDREGFNALRHVALTDASVTHLFVARRDRIARPDKATDGLAMEFELRAAGLTIVLMDAADLKPVKVGSQQSLAELLVGVVEYHQSGAFRRELAVKLINAKVLLARMGCSIGGEPPYGFHRWLCDAQGNPVRELGLNEIVKIPGHHVFWLPDDAEMLVVRRILEMYKTLPPARIAKILDAEGIPSPAAGRVRTINGVKRRVSGKWPPNTIRTIATHPLLVGLMEYGRRASGDQLRFTPTGPREIDYNDLDPETNKVRQIIVPLEDRVRTAVPQITTPVMTTTERQEIIDIREARGRHLKGIPRHRLGNFNPFGGRIFDMNCGWPMYRAMKQKKPGYTCALYLNTECKVCSHNRLPLNGGVKFALWAVRNQFQNPALIEQLKKRLMHLARDGGVKNGQQREQERLEAQMKVLAEDLKLAARNLARAKSDDVFDAIEAEITSMKVDLAKVESQLKTMVPVAITRDPQAEVDAALAVLERLPKLVETGAITEQATEHLFKLLDLRLYLRFRKHTIGRTFRNVIDGGVITFGRVDPPCAIYDGPTDRYIISGMIAAGEPISPIWGAVSRNNPEAGQKVGASTNSQRVTRRCNRRRGMIRFP